MTRPQNSAFAASNALVSSRGAKARRTGAAIILGFGLASARATTFMVGNTDDSGAGSLRQAIIDSNADVAAPNTIAFDIPGVGPHVITLATQLPGITHSVTVDGYTQTGAAMNTNDPEQGGLNGSLGIEVIYAGTCCISGFVLGNKDGVMLTVQGLALNHFGASAIAGMIQPGSSQLNVYGNYIGTTVDGSPATGSVGYGVSSGFTTAAIGGEEAWQRNLISGALEGLLIEGSAIVEGNLIGTDVSGTAANANVNYGVVVDFNTADAQIGGATAAARNVISGNGVGLVVENHYAGAGPVNWKIQGNFIGTDWTGTQRLPNGMGSGSFHTGILMDSNSLANFVPSIGGFDTGEANLIAYNDGPGIEADGNYLSASFDNAGNAIHHNAGSRGVNVDIGSTGPTPNDPGDADTGTNNVQNWPEILSASLAGNQLTVSYLIDTTTANAAFPLRVDFYEDIQGGSGRLIDEDIYTAADAQLPRMVVLTVPPGEKGMSFVATATDANGYSSEFSPAYDVIFEDDFD